MIRKVFDQILEAMYPTRAKCLGCGDEQGCDEPFLCETCRKMLRPSNIAAERDEWKESGLDGAAFVYYYERPIKGLIRAYKFKGVRLLADHMSRDIINLIEQRRLGSYDMIIPVPLHPSRKRERGFNQAELLAQPIAAACDADIRTDILKRVHKTKQQSKLKLSKRGENLRSAFSVAIDLTGKRVLLVDDVVTTGSTLCACAEALKSAGAIGIYAVTVAGSHAWRRGKTKKYRMRKNGRKAEEKVNRE